MNSFAFGQVSSAADQHLWSGICDFADEGEQTVQQDAMVAVPTDWLGWLEHLDAHDGRSGTRELAHRGSVEWEATALLESCDGVDQFAERLQVSRSTAAEQALRDCLPYLLACFQRDKRWPNPAFRPVYRALSELLYVSTVGSRSDLTVYGDLVESLISIGVSEPTEYRELVTTVMELWSRFDAPSNFDWALDMLSMLIVQPCADPAIRLEFLDALLQGFHRSSRHVRPEQWALMELLIADLGALERVSGYLPSPDSLASPADDPLVELSRASVALYSLTESTLRQVKRILERQYPGVKVSLNSDLVGSMRLKQLARQSDLFVMATASAKHAATEFIDANRPKSLPTLRAAGKGAASMIAALRNHFLGTSVTVSR